MELFRTFKYPANIFWEVTPMCNHNCVHCFNYWRTDSEETSEINLSSNAVDYLLLTHKIMELNPVRVVITGGEPFLVWDKIFPCIQLMRSKGLEVSINTNVTLITDEIARYLAKENISLFVSFPCHDNSICDCITDVEGSHHNILNGLDILTRNHVNFTCNMVISNKNIDYTEETVLFLKERYQIKRMTFSRVGKPINAADSFDSWLLDRKGIRKLIELSVAISKKHHVSINASSPYPSCALDSQEEYDIFGGQRLCSAGKSSCVIASDGSVKACPRDSKIYGNLLEIQFKEIWEGMAEWRNEEFYPKECRECNFFSSCLGGCRADQLANTEHCSGLDSAVRLEQLPLAFEKNKIVTSILKMDDKFTVPDGIRWDQDYDGYRMSLLGKHTYIKESAYLFFINTPQFTLKEFAKHFTYDYETAAKIVQYLLTSNLLNIQKH